MADRQFDVTPEQLKRIQENANRRSALRAEFLKQATDPNRHAKGSGGGVFDSALLRFNSMRLHNFEHFQATPRTSAYGLVSVVIPILGFAYYLKRSKECREKQLRSGTVAYKDRLFKFQ